MTGLAFKSERDALSAAATTVARVAGKAPPWTGVRLEVEADKLRLSTTDLDVSMSTTLAVSGQGDGAVVVPARRFAEMVKALREGAVTVEAADAALSLRCGASRGSLPLIVDAAFPPPPEQIEGEPMDAKALRAALAQVAPAASRDDTRPQITGVLFEPGGDGTLTLVATDSYRLHRTTLACDWRGGPALVPALALRELLRLPESDTLGVAAGDTSITFGVGETVLSARLLEGEFPNYRGLIGKPPHWLEADRDELAEAVARVDVAANETSLLVLAVDGDTARVSCANDAEAMADEVAVAWDGPALTLGLNARFLGEALAALGSERVRLGVTDALKPVQVVAGDGGDFLGLVVPIRL